MTLSPFVPSVGAEVVAVIDEKLGAIEQDNDVRILFAIESGSRAWGFPSPDSDYDVRFVYARQPDWYLSLVPGRDVIELPIDGDWDINGWDIRKALNLLVKPNPVLLEWLSSPIRYRWSEADCAPLVGFAEKTAFGAACIHHYRNLARQQMDRHLDGGDVNYKKYFYILRPALAIDWVRQNRDRPPPMNLQAMVGGLALSDDLLDAIEHLLILKAKSKEIGRGPRVPEIDGYIANQMAWAEAVDKETRPEGLLNDAEGLFRRIVKGDV